MLDLKNSKVLVIGLAKSGLAATKVLNKYGANITLTEKKDIDEKDLELLKSLNVKVVKQCDEVFDGDYDLVIKNPGVPPVSPIVKKLQSRNIKIITEVELAFELMKKQNIVAITGTNGKTTTTTLVYELLKAQFKDKAHCGGNIGKPLCDILLDEKLDEVEGHYISLEISNAQLIDTINFKPDVATIINLTPDHIETMGSLDNYYKSKCMVYQNMDHNDLFILNSDDEVLKEYISKHPIKSRVETFSLDNQNTDDYIKDNYIYINKEKVLDINNIKIVGKHNVQNIIIAVAIARYYHIPCEVINNVIANFKGVEHRIEYVDTINGAKYYNDSKGTNVDSTEVALKAFDNNIILLVGGYEKGLDVTPLKKYMNRCKKVIGFGLSGKRIASELANDAIIVTTLDEAINEAHKLATTNDIVLLSPTTSSFDQYSCYEERGEHFKKLVKELKR